MSYGASVTDQTAICAECDTYVSQNSIMKWLNKEQAVGVCLECWSDPSL